MEKRKTDHITLWQEWGSLYFSLIGITFNQMLYMENEYERASWRRVGLTIFIGVFISAIVTQIIRVGVFAQYSILSAEYFSLKNELFDRLWELGTGIVVTLIIIFATAYVTRTLFISEEDESEPYPLVSYVQIFAILKTLEAILVASFINAGSLMLNFNSLAAYSRQGNNIIIYIPLVIGLVIGIYTYFLLTRMLKIETDFRGRAFWWRFIVVLITFEGVGFALQVWIAPIILNPIYRILYQSILS